MRGHDVPDEFHPSADPVFLAREPFARDGAVGALDQELAVQDRAAGRKLDREPGVVLIEDDAAGILENQELDYTPEEERKLLRRLDLVLLPLMGELANPAWLCRVQCSIPAMVSVIQLSERGSNWLTRVPLGARRH